MILRRLLAFAVLGMSAALAQEAAGTPEPPPRIELEYVSSSIYRTGMGALKIWRNLYAETEYFGNPDFDVAHTTVGWMFIWKKNLRLSPGFGIGYGSDVQKAPVASLRWKFETKRWFSQGVFIKALGGHVFKEENGKEVAVRAVILDNNHFSVKLNRFEVGPMWERIRYRTEDEWKGGVRGAVRWKKFKGIVQAVGPGFEVRGGVEWEY